MKDIYDEAIETIDNIFMCVKSNGDYDDECVDYNLQSVRKTLERAKKVEELLGLYRKHYRNDVVYDHNGKLIHQIMKLEEELK